MPYKNPEDRRAYEKRRYASLSVEKKEEMNRYARELYARNPKDSKEKVRIRAANRRLANPERYQKTLKKQWAENKEYYRDNHRKNQANYPPGLFKQQLTEQGGKCAICSVTMQEDGGKKNRKWYPEA
jgi:hypothetical protein